MAGKDALISDFTDAKWDAEAKMDRIGITPTMSQGFVEGAHGLIEMANKAYLRMYKLYSKIQSLQDVSLTGDDLESLKADLDDVRGMIHDSRR